MAGILAIWALIPVKAIESSWRAQQETMVAWVGAGTQRWIESQAAEILSQFAKEGAKAVNGMGSSQIDGWLAERLYVTLRWASLVVYLLVAESATNILHRFTEGSDAADKCMSSVG